jgi:hypothetical protein
MGVEYNQFGEVCKSSKQAKERKFVWEVTTVFRQSMFLHEQQAERRKEELGAGETMEGELWSMLEHLEHRRLKSQVVRPEE